LTLGAKLQLKATRISGRRVFSFGWKFRISWTRASFGFDDVFVLFFFVTDFINSMSRVANELYEFGDFRLNVGEHKLERLDGRKNGSLPEKAFQTLVHLVRNSGILVTKEELLSAVWPDVIVEENNLGKAIHAIRHCLDEKTGEQKYIETIPKHGYRFVADVRMPDAAQIDPARTAPESSPGDLGQLTKRSSNTYLRIAAVLALAGLLGIIGWIVIGNRQSTDTSGNAARARAYDLYVRGKVKVGSENREDTEAAITVLQQAVAIDPNFAEAYAALARGYNTMAFKYSSGVDTKRFHENAEVAIEKALALAPDLAEAHFARGLILWTNTKAFPHEQAIQSYKRSIALDPTLDEAHHQLSTVYSHIGLMDEARRSVDKALEINPNNTLARYRSGVYSQYQGKFDEAITVFKTIPRDHTPILTNRSLAEVLIQTGRLDEAEALVEDHLGRNPRDEGGSFTSVKALLLAKAGKQAEAEDAIGRAIRIGEGFGHFHHTAYNIASAYAAMNDPEKVVQWLEIAAETGFPCYTYFEIDPNLAPVRQDKRFIAFMTQLKPGWQRLKNLV
jgi:DNA-binding winged helix-turn-helix (wHTH) protein/Tfp pilus assembly protein PilF